LLIVGVAGLIFACLGAVVAGPLSMAEARRVRNLPRPEPAALVRLEPGTRALVMANAPNEVGHELGLSVYYVEYRKVPPGGTPTPSANADRAYQWQRMEVSTAPLMLAAGGDVQVRPALDASFRRAEQTTQRWGYDRERRIVGYLPGQALAVDGAWQGNGLFVANVLYPGTIDEYVDEASRAPGRLIGGSIVCASLCGLALVAGVVLRILGR
jgi:hypothetical protein